MARHGFFRINSHSGAARSGLISTAHGKVETPVFMPVATQGSVKALDPQDLKELGARVVLGNAYHLYLRPGDELIHGLGGLHKFMGWDRPILTDSGGFQGFSLKHLRNLHKNGITFRSHIDGSTHTLSPESIMQIQANLGSDIAMPLDVCLPSDATHSSVSEGIVTTFDWVQRCKNACRAGNQFLFGIVQGGLFKDLRKESIDQMISLDMPGYSIGGLSVGESKSQLYETAGFTADRLPQNKPRYLMGVGSPEDLVECVARGVDMFDCVLPSRVARNGALYTKMGRFNITSARFKNIDDPFDVDCDCYACSQFSAAYIHHLFRAKEYLAYRLATIHNLRFVIRLMEEMRTAISTGSFPVYRKKFWENYRVSNEIVRTNEREKWLKSSGLKG